MRCNLVAAHCDLMIALCEGEIIAEGPPQQTFRQETRCAKRLSNRRGDVSRVTDLASSTPLSLEAAVDMLAPSFSRAGDGKG